MVDNKEGTLILGIENPLLDISAKVQQDVYERFNLPMDATILAEAKHLPLFQELKDKYHPTYIPGGSTQNTLRAAQVSFLLIF
jgi:adenosine kinase